jgi:chromosomal replication initiation ATPase DnaA
LLVAPEYGLAARNVALWAVWQLCDLTLREIGTIFGGMDYAAVAQRIRRLERNKSLQSDLRKLLQQCQNV